MAPEIIESTLRVRMGTQDAHYGGNLVDGARILALFGDLATELLIKLDGDEGLFLRYDEVEFKAPVYAGDYIEARGRVTVVGGTLPGRWISRLTRWLRRARI
jgi:3-aminobutyryl-CoA ammonia-lyase